jgi:hypothetical protein
MQIIEDFPPGKLYSAIAERFPAVKNHRVIFAYGDVIFNPQRVEITPALLAHEGVHGYRQGNDPMAWWGRYLNDIDFVFQEELVAHVAEAEAMMRSAPSRQQRRRAIPIVARKLAAPIYGPMITTHKARTAITKAMNDVAGS